MEERLKCKLSRLHTRLELTNLSLQTVLFNAYDTDGSGTLTPDEVFNIFKASLASKGEAIDNEEISKMVSECFRQIDINNDGEINFEEFKSAVTNQQLMISCFVHYPQQQQQESQQASKEKY